ncbi:F-box/kelch-repeat protein At3g06240-like [Papaver somniferum]|uniref:F-box/kelch-repeat protein At3g06240-like n=1 Tax=Papaver somniferum TaxID=3469 RepID=UPI000E6FE3DF|nr:F-box/kelch-repeat protein At3g06240-like [Papaver somniferum]
MIVATGHGRSEVWVSRLRSKSWNRVGDIPYGISDIDLCVKPLNGIIHGVRNYKVIVSVDIVEERTKELQIPSRCLEEKATSGYDYMEVGVLGDELYLLVNPRHQGNIDLWVMKDYGVVDSWTKIITISEYQTGFEKLTPLGYLKNGEILLKGERLTSKDSLVLYDPKIGRLVTLDTPGMPEYFRAATLVGSLFSLYSGVFVKD